MPRQGLSTSFAVAAMALPSPLVAGDRPDPTVLRADDGEYVTATTSGGWAPSFRVLRSPDLRSWRTTGEVFRRPPRWVQSLFWAPELTRLGGGYAIFYSALHRSSRRWFCLGVATAPTPEGPWRDRGRPLRCGSNGSIDPQPVRDEAGRLNLVWKADGNQFARPTPIFAQRLREDGMQLLGRPHELIRNDRAWEGRVVEAPLVLSRPDGYLYMLYSAGLCCSKRCHYKVGVARARRLFGPWRKYSGNPILVGGNGWRCPGHTGVIDDGAGGLIALFHAYRAGAERLAGRQLLGAPLTFGPTGWPAIGDGRPPAPSPGANGTGFEDDFAGPLNSEWEWPVERVPGMSTGNGLRLVAPVSTRKRTEDPPGVRRPRRVDGGILSRRLGTASYTATTAIDTGAMGGETVAGISAYRNGAHAIGVYVGDGAVTAWRLNRGRFETLATAAAPRSPVAHLRMVARGRRFFFEKSPDGVKWARVPGIFNASVWDSARLALTVGGERRAHARFVTARLAELAPPGPAPPSAPASRASRLPASHRRASHRPATLSAP